MSREDVPDYTFDSYFAKILCKRIENYYRTLGYPNVRAWVEKNEREGLKPFYSIQSNIVMKVPERV